MLLLLSISAFGQNKFTLSGKVLDRNSQPLSGASVYINGTNTGSSTDRNGQFELKGVSAGEQELRVSFTGFKKYRSSIQISGNRSNLRITMTPTTGTLGEIVITGTGTPHHIKTAPVPTELYNKQDIERIAAPDLKGLLGALSPSVDFSPNAMGQNLQINGLSNDFVTILVDGKRMSGDIGGNIDLSRINMANVERIEVVKGASSSLYGSDAIGGVINIITKKSKQKISFINNSYVSNYNTINQDNTLSLNFGKLSSKTHFSLQQTDGWQNSPYELEDDSLVATPAMTQNEFKTLSFDQSLGLNITEKLSASASVSVYKKDNINLPELYKYNYLYEDLSYDFGMQYLFNTTDRLTIDYHSDRFTYSYQYNQEYKTYPEDTIVEQNQQIRDDVNLKYIKRFSRTNTMTLGAEYVGEEYISEGRVEGGEASTYTVALYGQDELTLFEDLNVVAGARMVYNEEFGTEVTPKISLLYKLNDFNFRGTYSRGFKSPTLKEFYYRYQKGSSLYLGNADLKAQTSNYYNVGVDYNTSFIGINVSAYSNQVDNLIGYVTVETSAADAAEGVSKTKQQSNIEEAKTQGVDVMMKAFLPLGFSVGAGYSYVDARNLTNDVRLEYVAKNHLNANLSYRHSWEKYDLNAMLLLNAQDEKFFLDGMAPAYKIYKLATTHKLAPMGIVNLTVTAGIDNILDYVDDTPYGGNRGTINPGRTYYAGLIIQLRN